MNPDNTTTQNNNQNTQQTQTNELIDPTVIMPSTTPQEPAMETTSVPQAATMTQPQSPASVSPAEPMNTPVNVPDNTSVSITSPQAPIAAPPIQQNESAIATEPVVAITPSETSQTPAEPTPATPVIPTMNVMQSSITATPPVAAPVATPAPVVLDQSIVDSTQPQPQQTVPTQEATISALAPVATATQAQQAPIAMTEPPAPPTLAATPTPSPETVASVQTSEQLSQQIYSNICTQIIREQENIIGSLALEQASLVDGLLIDGSQQQTTCKVVGDGVVVVDNLIQQYQDFFGHAAVEVCKEAAAQLIVELETTEIPNSLR